MAYLKNIFMDARDKFIKKFGTRKKIKTIDELLDLPNQNGPHVRKVHHVDLSELDLSDHHDMLVGELDDNYMPTSEAIKNKIILNWTDDVIWPQPDKMPNGFDPKQILEAAKYPVEMHNVHSMGKTGAGIGIAIIDQRLYRDHPEYADQIKHYEHIDSHIPANGTDYHGSLVAGCAVGKTTGTAPDANLYYFSASASEITKDGKRTLSRKYKINALKRILEINKTLPETNKIRFISCSWGTKDDLYEPECRQIFEECERNGIMIIGGAYKPTATTPIDKRYPSLDPAKVGIPTNGKTTPFWQGGYYYTRLGGSSSTFPYLAGVFACALQGNTIFCTRQNWQDELIEIMKQTATEHPMGGKIINPTGIVERVSQIARTMEINQIKQQVSQHE